ncbi:PQQ-binding-like beta-propeller repeat protein [Haloplanus halophilus]|uniref:outer membrane protein assembly factor BamB family protein n=1 Tax=Haloplanus halophilus TaxID=2949993 RepID=UPI00203D15C9|nr:PQQ-binding-like beta-propeller repeat protein [Haloplanus sp. GDY1]
MVSRRTTLQAVGSVFAGVGAGCIGSSGPSSDRIRWRRSIRGTPLLDGGVLYAMDRLTLYALSPADGGTQWTAEYSESEFDRRLCLRSDIAVDDGRVYVPGCDGLRALRRPGGERAWFVGSPLRGGVAVGDGRVYANADDLLAVDAEAGTVDWRVDTGGERLTTPAATADGVVFTNRVDGVVTAFDTDGERRWRYRTDAETRSPTVEGETVYVATSTEPGRAGRLIALNRADGSVRWAVDTPSPKRGTRPVVDGDAVYLGCSGRDHGTLVALDRSDGAERWSYADENSTVYQPAVTDDAVYAGSNDDRIYAFSRAGEHRWQLETNSTVGTVVAGDDALYAANNERLFAIER